jgi:hypothetical protein
MIRRSIQDERGRFSLHVEIHDTMLEEAIGHDNAEDVLKCAFILALSVLTQAGPWPGAALHSMSSFMTEKRSTLISGLQ